MNKWIIIYSGNGLHEEEFTMILECHCNEASSILSPYTSQMNDFNAFNPMGYACHECAVSKNKLIICKIWLKKKKSKILSESLTS